REGRNVVEGSTKHEPFYEIGPDGSPILQIAYGEAGDRKLAVVICEVNGQKQVHAATLAQKKALLGRGRIEVGDRMYLSDKMEGMPARILVNSSADGVLVANEEGEVFYF